MSVYETFKFASLSGLREAFMGAEITRPQMRVLLVRKGYTGKQADMLIKGWE